MRGEGGNSRICEATERGGASRRGIHCPSAARPQASPPCLPLPPLALNPGGGVRNGRALGSAPAEMDVKGREEETSRNWDGSLGWVLGEAAARVCAHVPVLITKPSSLPRPSRRGTMTGMAYFRSLWAGLVRGPRGSNWLIQGQKYSNLGPLPFHLGCSKLNPQILPTSSFSHHPCFSLHFSAF